MMARRFHRALLCFLLVNHIAATVAKTPETRADTILHREKRNTRGTSLSDIFSQLFPVLSSQGESRGKPSSGQTIRLRGSSSSPYANRVEVYINNKWGIICDDYWDITDANVTCRQLGYPDGAESAPTRSRYGSGLHSRSDILMDDTMCRGYEQSILDCPYRSKHDCQKAEASSVICRAGRGCPEGWVYNNGLCYKLFTEPQSFARARAQCTIQGGRLLYINSQQENDFLSDWIINSYPQAEVRSGVWTGARWSAGAWNWTDSAVGRVKYTNWFPGFPEDRSWREPRLPSTNQCVKLVETIAKRPPVRLDYFHWATAGCLQTMPYVCKKIAREPGDCYTGDGSSYRGNAFRTEHGSLCINWSDVDATKRLGHHNHCRNPDSDKQPWCWTNATGLVFGYCQIPKCGETETSSIDASVLNTVTTNPCTADDMYFCHSSTAGRKCIPTSWRCDGDSDCDKAEDELDCPDRIDEFVKYPGRRLPQSMIKFTYSATLLTCANLCLNSRNFVCRSMIYTEDSEECGLSEKTRNSGGGLTAAPGVDFYELKSQAETCSSSEFSCQNGRCISRSLVCNGHDNCNDFSDEESCPTQAPPLELRLTGQSEDYRGTVEVRYKGEWGIICDDNWDRNDANVVCKQLGFDGAVRAATSAEFGMGNGNFLMDEVECTGRESSLEDCTHNGWRNHDCQVYESAGVVCNKARGCENNEFQCKNKRCVLLEFVCDGDDDCLDNSDELNCAGSISIRLVNGSSAMEGRVHITRNGVDGTICDDEWDDLDATVVCKMLGFNGLGLARTGGRFGPGTGIIWLDNVECTGAESSLAECERSDWARHNCDHAEDAGVICTNTPVPTRPAVVNTTTSSVLANCGSRPIVQPLVRIVGGYTAMAGAYPWQAAVRKLQYGVRWGHWCGATILNEDWLLSAAHCFRDAEKDQFRIRVGEHDQTRGDPYESDFQIEELIPHRRHRRSNNDYDYALLKIRREGNRGIQMSRHVQPACLPKPTTNYRTGLKCFISGWGAGENGAMPQVLKVARVPLIGQNDCEIMYKYVTTPRMFCAGYKRGGIDTCQGDSGGPLVCQVDGKHTLLGVTSWGNGCAVPNSPGIYARVTTVLDWIHRYVR